MRTKNWFVIGILFLILVIAAGLRVIKLGSNPPHLTPDEAALGYNAFSILKTGRDEYGEFLPVIFKSFGDYKPGLYVYLTVPFVWALGLGELAVRLPSALAGVGGVWLIYLIVKKLFSDQKLALTAALVTAINPWAIQFSRGAWEVNVSLTLTLAGIYLFLKAFDTQKYLIWSALAFGATLLSYQGAKLSSGLIVILLLVIYSDKVVKFKRTVLVAAAVAGVVVSLPILMSVFQGKTGRLTVFSVFSYPRADEYLDRFLSEAEVGRGSLTYDIFYPESLSYLRGIMGRWFNHYSTRFLVFEGDWQNPRHTAPNVGVLLWADLAGLLAGLFVLLKQKINRNTALILWWMVAAPLPAILSRDQIHAVRSYNLVVPLVIVIAFGVCYVIDNFKRLKWVLLLTYLVSWCYYLDALFIHLPKHDSEKWDYGYKQIVEAVSPIQYEYREVRVQQSFAQPYIYFLFYQKYDPASYQKQAGWMESDVKGDVGRVERLDNIYFGPIDWTINRGRTDTLFVADIIRIPVEDSSDPERFKTVKEINYLNGKIAFRIIKVIK